MRSSMKKKLSSCTGETIGETLVALLISALALMMLAGAISAAMRVVTGSREKINAYYQVNNAVAARATTAPKIDGVDAPGFGTGKLTVTVQNLLPTGVTIPQVDYWKNGQLSGVQVVAYTKPTPASGT